MPKVAKIAKMARHIQLVGAAMHTQSAKDAKYHFGRLVDTARAEPVVIEKHGRPVVVVLAIEEYRRLIAIETFHVPVSNTASNTSGKRHA